MDILSGDISGDFTKDFNGGFMYSFLNIQGIQMLKFIGTKESMLSRS